MTLAEIARRYRDGESTVQIGRAAGLHPETVRRRLHAAGVEMRPHAAVAGRRRLTDEDIDRTLDLLADLGTATAVAARLGVHQTTVSQRLRRTGVSPAHRHHNRLITAPEGHQTVAQYADRHGLTTGTVQHRIRTGRLHAIRDPRWPSRYLIPTNPRESTT
ncbi:MAG: hypothetical protein M0P31_15510 [Solirubrobacteraceae bacterium]|nr:hypothetical protein [Solirubrobacteraceae bacterium]